MKSFKQFLSVLSESDNLIYYRDNPGGDWLRYKQEHADDPRYARLKGLGGAITASFRNVNLPAKLLRHIPGALGEENYRHPGQVKYDYLAQKVKENGWNQEWPVLIGVNHHGHVYVLEGNHRIQVAYNMSIPHHIKAEIRYFNGGEDADGEFHPDKVRQMVATNEL